MGVNCIVAGNQINSALTIPKWRPFSVLLQTALGLRLASYGTI
jgi:hypothetical protein